MRRIRYFAPLLFVGCTVFACSSDSPPSEGGGGEDGRDDRGNGPGVDVGGAAGAPTVAQETVGEEGGSITTLGAELTFPPGALPGDVEVIVSGLTQEEVAELPALVEDIAVVSAPVRFQPHGLTFDEPVAVNLNYSPSAGDGKLAVLKLEDDDDTTWEYVPGATFKDGTATFTITSFSIYGVFSDPEGKAEEIYSNTTPGMGGAPGSGGNDGNGGNDGTGATTSSGGTGGGVGGDGGGPSGGTGGAVGGDGGGPSGGGTGAVGGDGGGPSGGGTGAVGGDGGGPSGGGTGGGATGGEGGGSSSGGASSGGGTSMGGAGSGGDTGMGGAGSGGSSSGTGGSTSAGGTSGTGGWGMGGMGGVGGGPGSIDGYFDNGEWRGFRWAHASAGSYVEYDPEWGEAYGELGVEVDDFLLFAVNLNQLHEEGAEPQPVFVSGDGLYLEYSSFGATRAQLMDESGKSWCAEIGAGGFTPWTAFSTTCWDEEAPGDAFNALTDSITAAGIIMPSSGAEGDSGYLTVYDLRAMDTPTFGHFSQSGFSGNAFTIPSVGVTAESDHESRWELPVQANGTVPASLSARFVLAFNLNQETIESPAGTFTPSADGLFLDLSFEGPMRIVLGNGTTEWCAELYGQDDAFLPWSAFNTQCWNNGGDTYNREPVQWLGFSVTGIEAEERDFSMSVFGFGEVDLSSSDYGHWETMYFDESVGDWTSWQGYASSNATGANWAQSSAGRTTNGQSCMRGQLAEDATGAGRAELLVTLNEWERGTVGTVNPALEGLRLSVDEFDVSLLRAVIIDESGVEYCKDISGYEPFVAWGDFNTKCWDGTGLAYDGAVPLARAGLVVPSLLDADHDYDVCLYDARPGLAPRFSYYDDNGFSGYVWTANGGDTTISTNKDERQTGESFCAWGELGASQTLDHAMLGFNLNQAHGDDTPANAYYPEGDALSISGSVSEQGCGIESSFTARVVIQDVGGVNYCANLGTVSSCDGFGIGSVPWTEFAENCWDEDNAVPYDGVTGLRSASIQVAPVTIDAEAPLDYRMCFYSAYDDYFGGGGQGGMGGMGGGWSTGGGASTGGSSSGSGGSGFGGAPN